MSATKVKITTRHINAFVDAAPLHLLHEIKLRLDRRIRKLEQQDVGEGVMRAMMSNSDFGNAPMPGYAGTRSVSEAESAPVENSYSVAGTHDARGKLDLADQIDSAKKNVEEYDAEIIFDRADNYGNGSFLVTGALKEACDAIQDKCETNSWYCPYSSWNGKWTLKIKGFRLSSRGEKVRATVRFKFWSSSDRSGYSCYADVQ